jgi:hypothetical protein
MKPPPHPCSLTTMHRYLLRLRTAPHAAHAAFQLVQRCCPGALLLQDGSPPLPPPPAGQRSDESASAGAAAGGEGGGGLAHLSFSLPHQHLDLAALFAAIEGGKAAAGIEEYSLSQASLEQVFLKLAGGGGRSGSGGNTGLV